MAFVFVLLTVVFSSAFLVLHFLVIPAAQLVPGLLPFHSAMYGLAFVALIQVLSSRIRSGKRSESGLRFFLGVYFFSFIGFHSLLVAGLLFELLAVLWLPLPQAALVGLLAGYSLAILGFVVAQLGPELVKINLGENSSRKLRLAQISDLHIGSTVGPNYVRKTVERVHSSKPDVIVLTGDIADGDPIRHRAAMEELAKLSAPLGVFLVLGNHELYWPTNAWIEAFRAAGMKVLIDDLHPVAWGETIVHFLGLSPNREESVAHHADKENLIVLAHYPHRAVHAAEAKARLFLAGHTHGGQFWPWSWAIYFFHRYAKGHYRVDETDIYISRGTGYWGPPLRFGQRAEITLIELGLADPQ